MADFKKGQRWVSESEPELGVGVIVDTAPGRVFVLFRASNTTRQYATGSAPIKRVEFKAGDTIKIHDGENLVVDSVEIQADGVLIYRSGKREIPETELSDTLSFSKPEDRLYAGQVDDSATFDLRYESLRRRNQIRRSPVRGLVGARIDLIPHQLYIAHEVASRVLPRVLLADEVGLGKTIEACLVLHRLHRSGRAARILILVPEPLVHQWFVEMLRRFNMLVSIFDEERCRSIEAGDLDANPFLDDQVILCPLPLLANDEKRAKQVADAGWDLLVVDEAHHLVWTPKQASAEYKVVETLAVKTPGVILLTATPEQLGTEGHFARLRLLDPDRYSDFKRFEKERTDYQQTAKITAKLLDEKPFTAADLKTLRSICKANPERLELHLAALKKGDAAARSALIQELLDQHGTGRVMFRNTRAAMKGFPKRRVYLEELPPDEDLLEEWDADQMEKRSYALADDARVEWLVSFLQKKRKAKVLLICTTMEKVLALEKVLRDRVNLKIGLFHEDLTLLQRDRNAAWFSEEDGAQMLICSEIGSEGRNFQFAHHLVLFDLPANPELLEQRIGRLDRIGQTETISIHVPFPKSSHLEVLARWYHEGLNAFEKSLEGGREIMGQFGKRLDALITGEPTEAELAKLIAETKTFHAKIVKDLEEGQDRLLQMNSCRADVAAEIVTQISSFDRDTGLDDYLLRVFDHFGVHVEELSQRTYLAIPAALTTDAFPELPEEGLTLTCDRTKALSREEIGFLTWDHPILTSAMDLLLGSEQGTTAFTQWADGGEDGIFLETIHVLEPVAPPALHADRFLPPTPIRTVVNIKGEEVSEEVNPNAADLKPGSVFLLLDNGRIKHKLLPSMLEKNRTHATERAAAISQSAAEQMVATLRHEVTRLQDLKKINDHVRDDEIALLSAQMDDLALRIKEAPLRLDSVRLIWRTQGV
ncbi:MAG: RNA polymerase-associated protein RapA [Chthoniobacterales bacterium]